MTSPAYNTQTTGLHAVPSHPRSATATRRHGARLTTVDPTAAPRTFGPAGVEQSPKAARGIILYIGLDESKAAAEGTNLTAVAQALQQYASELASQAETQAVIALAPEGRGSDIDAVRAVATGSPAATGTPAGRHGPVRSRVPSRITPPGLRTPEPRTDHGLHIDIPRREVHVDGTTAAVTTKEFDLLATLVARAGETLTRDDLIDALWTEGERPDERTIDVHIRRLRNRLGEYSSVVRTIRGAGYRFDEHPDVHIWAAAAQRW